jgi:SAM-dependent methyltransferase
MGLTAYARDFLHLDFPAASFDALFALNCLLHVPVADLPRVLQALHELLKPEGLFYLGQYGGVDRAGIEDTSHVAEFGPRFYAHHTDESIRRLVAKAFEIVSFKSIPLDHFADPAFHFQSLILRRR